MKSSFSIAVITFAVTIAFGIFTTQGAYAHGNGLGNSPHAGNINSVHAMQQMHKGKRVNPRRMRGVTPYGDFCSKCSKYGMGKRAVAHAVALEAMQYYFSSKGLTVRNVMGQGRFLKVDIYKDKALVDRILFDRRTGRIRSIY